MKCKMKNIWKIPKADKAGPSTQLVHPFNKIKKINCFVDFFWKNAIICLGISLFSWIFCENFSRKLGESLAALRVKPSKFYDFCKKRKAPAWAASLKFKDFLRFFTLKSLFFTVSYENFKKTLDRYVTFWNGVFGNNFFQWKSMVLYGIRSGKLTLGTVMDRTTQ